MKKLALVFLLLFGVVFGAFAKQKVSFWKAETTEEIENLFGWCQVEISFLVYMGYHIDCVAFNDTGYFIVYEDFSEYDIVSETEDKKAEE